MGTEEKEIYLTEREKTIINSLKRGNITSQEIARDLKISKCTVDARLSDIFIKHGFDNKQPRARLVWLLMCKIMCKISTITDKYIIDCAGFECEGMRDIKKLIREVI